MSIKHYLVENCTEIGAINGILIAIGLVMIIRGNLLPGLILILIGLAIFAIDGIIIYRMSKAENPEEEKIA